MKRKEKFNCFSKTMAFYLESHGCQLVNKYFSNVYDNWVYEFDDSERTWNIAQGYIMAYKKWKEEQEEQR